MKTIYKNALYVVLLVTVILFTGCNNYLDVNKNPNQPTDANMTAALIFPAAEVEVAELQACTYYSSASNNFASSGLVFLNRWMGYWGWPGDYSPDQEESSYNISYSFSNGVWANYYNTLFDLHQAQTKAIAAGDTVLAGASMVLSDKLWQEVVDIFGDVPYSQAFQYDQYSRPAYDKAPAIYASLQTNLDQAIGYLHKTPLSTFASIDVVFNGNTAQWNKLANTLKLRLLIRQSETTYKSAPPTAEIAKIISNGGVLEAGESASANPGFTNTASRQSPFYAAYGKTSTGADASATARANSFFVALMNQNNDPRATQFFTTISGSVVGTVYGLTSGNPKGSACSEMGPGIANSASQNAWIMPSFESMFLHAEAAARGWMTDVTAQAEYQAAVTESFVWLRVPNADTAATHYLKTAPAAMWSNAGTTVSSQVNFIDAQKYMALAGIDALEAWSDYRRLGKATIPATAGSYQLLSVYPSAAKTIPIRLLYPQSEYTSNFANVPTENAEDQFTKKIFWQP
jgi:hypothetical protein